MSRIGKLPVQIPEKVTVSVEGHNVSVTGPKGTLSLVTRPEVAIEVKGNEVLVSRFNDEKPSKSYHGLYRQLIHNMVVGVSEGYRKSLLINGVGYRAEVNGNIVLLTADKALKRQLGRCV